MRDAAFPGVCIIDDDDAVRDSLGELLKSHGIVVRGYESALLFLKDCKEQVIDCSCLLVDLHMPGMNGLELLELLHSRHSNLPVILITARSDSALKQRARRSGAIVVLDKPVDEHALLTAIKLATDHAVKGIPMTLKTIRLELARSKDYPTGDPSHGYVLRAPLDSSGHIDEAHWKENRDLCAVRRIEHWHDVESGTLHRAKGGHWVFSYKPGDKDAEALFRMSKHTFAPGEYVSLTEHDGVERTFRVTQVLDWHPHSPSTQTPKLNFPIGASQ